MASCSGASPAPTSSTPRMFPDRACGTTTLLSAIWHLSTFEDSDGKKKRGPRRRVNFAGLDVEELGSVYEALLDYHPQVTIEGERSRFELVAGSERKIDRLLLHAAGAGARADQERVGAGHRGSPRQGERRRGEGAGAPVAEGLRPGVRLGALPARGGPADRARAGEGPLGRGRAQPGRLPARGPRRDPPLHLCRRQEPARRRPLQGGAVDRGARERPAALLPRQPRQERRQPGRRPRPRRASRRACPTAPTRRSPATTRRSRATSGSGTRPRRRKPRSSGAMSKASIDRIAGAFAAVADLPETTPDEVHAKEARYVALQATAPIGRGRSAACDLWTAAFFAPLTADGKAGGADHAQRLGRDRRTPAAGARRRARRRRSPTSSASSTGRWSSLRCSHAAAAST